MVGIAVERLEAARGAGLVALRVGVTEIDGVRSEVDAFLAADETPGVTAATIVAPTTAVIANENPRTHRDRLAIVPPLWRGQSTNRGSEQTISEMEARLNITAGNPAQSSQVTVRFDYGRANVTELKLADASEPAAQAVEFAFKNVLEARLSLAALSARDTGTLRFRLTLADGSGGPKWHHLHWDRDRAGFNCYYRAD